MGGYNPKLVILLRSSLNIVSESLSVFFKPLECVCVSVCECVCVSVSVCVRERESVCVCVYV